MNIRLDQAEARALGSLVEKSLTTREQYPLSFNALLNACNQKTSREPVMTLDAETLGRAVGSLIEKGLAERLQAPGERVPKFRHDIHRLINSDDPRIAAVITLLLLRGPQTPGEIKARSERLCSFGGTAEVEGLLRDLSSVSPEPMVARLPRQSGQKEARYAHLFSEAETAALPAPEQGAPAAAPRDALAGLEKRVVELEAAVRKLQDLAAGGGAGSKDAPAPDGE